MVSNFHTTAFDDATLLKLEIYKAYVKTWLPVFIERKYDRQWNGNINIFDFFSGPGIDAEGKPGSPLIAIEQALLYAEELERKNRKVNLFFSDVRPRKIEQLRELLAQRTLPATITTTTSTKAFKFAFMNNIRLMTGSANLLFIDQCGVKEVDKNVFNALIGLRGTDFLFFIASSFFRRFRDSDEFKKYLDASGYIDKTTPYEDSHRVIAAMYRRMIPKGTTYFLAPLSIKKGANIYGLIFGSAHLLGILKFLEICWKIDPLRGEANYDIDRDNLPDTGDTLDLFKDNNRSTKVTRFQMELRNKVLAGAFHSDLDIFRYTLENGFLPGMHAKEVVAELIKENKLVATQRPRFSKDCIKEPRSISLC